jgi:nucleoside-diphosphate-sugar epimerase
MQSILGGARIMITGAAGFIGGHAMRHFAGLGCETLGTDVRPPRLPFSAGRFVACDLLDAIGLHRLVTDFSPTYLIHLGARTDTFERRSLEGYAANTRGTMHVIAAANGCPRLRRLLLTSSRLVCPVGYMPKTDYDYRPPNLYGESKAEMERIIRRTAIRAEWLITRPTGIWGPGFLVPSYRDFFEQIRSGRYVHIGDANPRKTFGYVGNTVFQIQRLLEAPAAQVHGRVFYLGDYEPVALREWADLIASGFGRRLRTLPLGTLRLGAVAGDLMVQAGWRNFPLTSIRLRNMLSDAVHDLAAVHKLTGPLPFRLDIATRETVSWLRENP